MSVRDEIAERIADVGPIGPVVIADALLPIVGRVARACIDEVHRADLIRRNPVYKGPEPLSDDAIVQKLMEGGQ